MAKQKLELTWIGKDKHPRLEPRILIEDPERSHHAAFRTEGSDLFGNRLLFGDNLLALAALEQEFIGQIKCIYIDPPFNTGQAFRDYPDGLEHSIWLSLMRDRLLILRRLLAPDGCIWVHCDDNEQAYLKVMMDELFGRNNFITAIIWRKVDSPNDNKVPLTPDHDYVLLYAKQKDLLKLKQKPDDSLLDAYRGPDEAGRYYRDRLLKKNGKNSLRSDRPSMYFPVTDPDGNEILPIHDDGREARWALGEKTVRQMERSNEIIWKQREKGSRQSWVPYTREFAPANPQRPYPSIWTDVMTSRQSKAHLTSLFPGETVFETPKPEQLLARMIAMCTDEEDWVLDSFAGSGSTGATAHKMGRRWIMIELGEHCHTHIIPRMKKVIDGQDPGGITKAVDWKGGGGFRYYKLAPSLLEKDKFDNLVISKQYNAAMLAEAMCKLMGFQYAPSETIYWQHGHSTERDFIYVTTQTLTREQLAHLNDEVGSERALLVCCSAFRGKPEHFPNLTIEKIPTAVLHKCEWGQDDYSRGIVNLPMKTFDDEIPADAGFDEDTGQLGLFGAPPAAANQEDEAE